jgi:hypothetical protein
MRSSLECAPSRGKASSTSSKLTPSRSCHHFIGCAGADEDDNIGGKIADLGALGFTDPVIRGVEIASDRRNFLPSMRTSPCAKSPTVGSIEMMVPPFSRMRRVFGSARRRCSSVAASESWDCATAALGRQRRDGGAGRKAGTGLQQSTTRCHRLKLYTHPSLPSFGLPIRLFDQHCRTKPRSLFQMMSISRAGSRRLKNTAENTAAQASQITCSQRACAVPLVAWGMSAKIALE